MKSFAAIVFLMVLPAAASAQPYPGATGPHRGTVELGGGVTWTGGYDAGSATATLTRNPSTGTAPLTFFVVSGRSRPAVGAGVHLGVFLARHVSAEATLQYSRPILRVRVTNDFESAPDTNADQTITSYVLGGSLLYHFGDGRFVPFVSGGGGYLRQVHEAGADVLTASEVHAGGGLRYWLGMGAHRFGLRVDAQASARSKSVAFVQKRRFVPTFGAGIAYQF
jgi:hypothetical protein